MARQTLGGGSDAVAHKQSKPLKGGKLVTDPVTGSTVEVRSLEVLSRLNLPDERQITNTSDEFVENARNPKVGV